MIPRVLLVTTVNWPSAARLASAFAGAGARVEALFPAGHVCAQSRFLSGAHLYSPYFPVAALGDAIAKAQPDLIVPCDDRALGLLRTAYARDIAAAPIARSLGDMGSYATLVSRDAFIAEARELGLAAPRSAPVESEAELELELSWLGFPAVLKADGSWGGEGVAIVRDLESALAAYRKFATAPSRIRSLGRAVLRQDAHFLRHAFRPPQPAISVQGFVSGKPATSTFACWRGQVLASIHMDVLESQGATGPASVMRRTDCPQMEEAAVRIAHRFGLSGLHGLDFVRDAAGQPHLIEINPRATQASAFAFGPGHDVAAALAACIAPSAIRPRPAATANPTIALFPQEWRRDPNSPWFASAHPDVPWDDPAVLLACLAPGEQAPERRSAESAGAAPLTLRQAVGR